MEWVEELQLLQQRCLGMFEAAQKLALAQIAVMESVTDLWRQGLAQAQVQQNFLRVLTPR